MKQEKNKISVRQLMLLLVMLTFSPAIRLFPSITVGIAKQASWLSPIVACLVMLVMVLIMDAFFKHNQDMGLADVICKILGKVIGRVLIAVYYLWIFILLALYIRYYAERITQSIFPETSIQFFIIPMMILVYFVLQGGLEALARYNELLLAIFALSFVVFSVLALSNFNFSNLFPVSYKDIVPVAGASYGILAIWGYYFFMFFLGDKVNDKASIKAQGFKTTLYLGIIAITSIALAIGVLGASLTLHLPLPYFTVVKIISVMGIFERLESVVLSLWVVVDFVLITVFCFFILNLSEWLFKLKSPKNFATPIVLIAYVLSLFISKNRFELSAFSIYFDTYANVILEICIPILLFAIGKIRKVI